MDGVVLLGIRRRMISVQCRYRKGNEWMRLVVGVCMCICYVIGRMLLRSSHTQLFPSFSFWIWSSVWRWDFSERIRNGASLLRTAPCSPSSFSSHHSTSTALRQVFGTETFLFCYVFTPICDDLLLHINQPTKSQSGRLLNLSLFIYPCMWKSCALVYFARTYQTLGSNILDGESWWCWSF